MRNGYFRMEGAGKREKTSAEAAFSSMNDSVSARERIREILFSAAMLGLCSVICWFFKAVNRSESNIVVLYIFFVFLISVQTANWIYSVCAAGLSVVIYNYLFTAPKFSFRAYDNRYTVSFGVMFLIALLTGVMAARLRTQARNSARMAFRIGVLYDTNQALEKCRNQDEIKEITAKQLVRLLHRNVLLYRDAESIQEGPAVFLSDDAEALGFSPRSEKAAAELAFQEEPASSDKRKAAADPVFHNGKAADSAFDTEKAAEPAFDTEKSAEPAFDAEKSAEPAFDSGKSAAETFFKKKSAESVPEKETAVFENAGMTGRGTAFFPEASCVYLPIRLNRVIYGVMGIDVRENGLDTYEENIVTAILGEAAIALENKRNEQEKEQARLMARNEQFRANLLRSISHDLRTPLTSISGTASLLLSDGDRLDDATRQNLYSNIYEDSMWLEDLVENLLSITRLKDDQTRIHTSVEFVSEVVEEARRHCSRKLSEHRFSAEQSSEVLLGKMDAHLIIQVLVNLVNNAVKYTPPGSDIRICAEQKGDMIQISVKDDGPGVSETDRPHIFEMFYSGKKTVADSSRSLGLGLALCREIVQAHGGKIWYEENVPHGSIFRFTIPAAKVRTDV